MTSVFRPAVPLALCVLVAAAPLRAERPERPADRTQRLYNQAQTLYRTGRFREAIERLEELYALAPEPILLFNLGRALEGAGELGRAIDAYERYLDAAPQAPNRAELRERISVFRAQLEAREAEARRRAAAEVPPQPPPVVVAPPVEAPPPSPPVVRRPRPIAASVLAGGALALAVVGAGLVGHVGVELGASKDGCCSRGFADGLATQAYVGYGAFAAAGALAVVDIALWVRWSRARHRGPGEAKP